MSGRVIQRQKPAPDHRGGLFASIRPRSARRDPVDRVENHLLDRIADGRLRAQVVLSLSGVVITVTGFSGRSIAETSHLARYCVSGGVLVVLAAAVVAIRGVLRLRWLSEDIDDEPVVTLLRGLEVRDQKSRNLRRALTIFVIGFGLYCVAIAQLLLAAQPPVR